MAFPLNLLSLCGAVALLLWDSHMVQTRGQRAFGPRMGAFLASALHGRLQAFLAGVGVTALLQSSTATALMVTGFAAAGMVDLVPALAVTLGANVWTTLSRPAAATQINGHIVAASAYPLLERTGELLPSRRVARKR